MKPLKEKVSITIDSDLLKELKIQAERDDRSLSQFINLVLRKYIEAEKEDWKAIGHAAANAAVFCYSPLWMRPTPFDPPPTEGAFLRHAEPRGMRVSKHHFIL